MQRILTSFVIHSWVEITLSMQNSMQFYLKLSSNNSSIYHLNKLLTSTLFQGQY